MTNKEAATIVKRIRYYMEGGECWTDAEFIAMDMAVKALEQPEIITCTECKYYDTDTEQCNDDKGLRFIDFSNPERMWCSWAERREDEEV